MTGRKQREPIRSALAARVLFLSDRTCCVCRTPGKPVQIHHIDEDPSNNSSDNLAVLCFDCHRDTQIRGGFDRKLDGDQVVLYRDDWHRLVMQQRATYEAASRTEESSARRIEWITSVAEIYREKEQYAFLASHYDRIGNYELRDKYIEIALDKGCSDETICFLRGLQGQPELIPRDVILREEARYSESQDWLQRARFYSILGRHYEAVQDYLRGIGESLEDGNVFSAAFYLKELVQKGMIEELFMIALQRFAEAEDLWWQVRTLQELGWRKELDDLVLRNAEQIDTSENPLIRIALEEARGDKELSLELRKEFLSSMREFGVSRDRDSQAD